ncbi:hypothetical protein [Mycolicibacterium fluoranthenivorans]|jgi:hypothetical protein|uniref:Lipoprotein n=1 Tax=Mycolicibacterium fluoranthenivorans TaxID=258505 RepID=A0A1G4WZB9_9MYCO|nr:hypothetical protein [Mycolicibacterium fluoranthenivorans]SCX32804.1 hypothetical protein SAMN02799620_05708 [Mycolicibacterium fluoranthenivorans]
MKSLLASCAAVAVALASAACGTSYGTSRSEAPQLAAYPAETPGGAAVTLGAATVSAQGIVDSFAAGDFAEVWEHMAQDVRQGITREDFVEFYKTCKKPGPRLSVEGLRMEPDGQAIVRVMNHGAGGSRFMVYEDGTWNMRATADFAAHLGQPLQRIISEEKAAGLCDS